VKRFLAFPLVRLALVVLLFTGTLAVLFASLVIVERLAAE